MKIYHNPKCSTSRKVLSIIQENGIQPEVVLYLNAELTREDILEILKKGDLRPKDILRTRDKAYKEKFINAKLTDDQWIDAILKNPSILERPVVVSENMAFVSRPIQRVLEMI